MIFSQGGSDDEEVLRWRRRIGQAQRVAELVAAGQRVYLGENAAGGLRLDDPPGRLICDRRGGRAIGWWGGRMRKTKPQRATRRQTGIVGIGVLILACVGMVAVSPKQKTGGPLAAETAAPVVVSVNPSATRAPTVTPAPSETPTVMPSETPRRAVVPPAATVRTNPNAFQCVGGCATPPAGCEIKGNVNSKKEKIYHVPGSRDYERTDVKAEEGDRWFCTEDEATAAGFRAPK